MRSKHEIKSRFLALNLILEYVDVTSFIAENPQAIREIIGHSSEAVVIGKYVFVYFEALLKKLWTAVGGNAEKWYAFWIDDYLEALSSEEDGIRVAACSHLTPILLKIHKMSLAYILSRFLASYKDVQHKSSVALESLMTLLKVAR